MSCMCEIDSGVKLLQNLLNSLSEAPQKSSCIQDNIDIWKNFILIYDLEPFKLFQFYFLLLSSEWNKHHRSKLINSTAQPYLLAIGMKKSTIHAFFIFLDKQVISCHSTKPLEVSDDLLKALLYLVPFIIRCFTTFTPLYRQLSII